MHRAFRPRLRRRAKAAERTDSERPPDNDVARFAVPCPSASPAFSLQTESTRPQPCTMDNVGGWHRIEPRAPGRRVEQARRAAFWVSVGRLRPRPPSPSQVCPPPPSDRGSLQAVLDPSHEQSTVPPASPYTERDYPSVIHTARTGWNPLVRRVSRPHQKQKFQPTLSRHTK